jgi:hypothetical protein
VETKEYGETGYVTLRMAKCKDTSAETVDIDSAKPLRITLINLHMFRKMEPRFYVAHPAYVIIAKSASQKAR